LFALFGIKDCVPSYEAQLWLKKNAEQNKQNRRDLVRVDSPLEQ
jgi:hypothetical protein